jgi:chromosome segregation ATPase
MLRFPHRGSSHRDREIRLEEKVDSLQIKLAEARECHYAMQQKNQQRKEEMQVMVRELQEARREAHDCKRRMREVQVDAFGGHDGRRRRERRGEWEKYR